jgi:hypothetical protein
MKQTCFENYFVNTLPAVSLIVNPQCLISCTPGVPINKTYLSDNSYISYFYLIILPESICRSPNRKISYTTKERLILVKLINKTNYIFYLRQNLQLRERKKQSKG